jgi:outer membrane protein
MESKMRQKTTMLILAMGITLSASMHVISQPLTLEQAIREVCSNSDSVKMMKESIKKSDEIVREKWANAWPVISATGAYVHNYGSSFGGSSSGSSGSSRSLAKTTVLDSIEKLQVGGILGNSFSGFSDPQHSDIYTTGISFNQPIYTFGKVETAIDVASNFNKSAKATYSRNMQTIQLGALDLFFAAMLRKKAAEIAEQSLSRKQELNGFLERNFVNGSGNKAQVLKTRADVADQISQTIIAKRDAKVMRMNLNAMMGRSLLDTTELDTVAMLDSIRTRPVPQPDDAVMAALSNRTDIKAMKLLAESNKGGATIFKAMYLPSIAATGSAGYTRMDSQSKLIGTSSNPSWSLGIGAQWMLFDGFANSAKANQYMSDARKLEIVSSAMEKMVEIDVRSQILECSAADSNFIASQEMFKSVQEGYNLTSSNFKQGSGQFADLQLADELLQQSELGMTNARYRLVRSRAALQVAMGREIIKINDNQKTK